MGLDALDTSCLIKNFDLHAIHIGRKEKSARLNSIGTVESSGSSTEVPLFSQLVKKATKRA